MLDDVDVTVITKHDHSCETVCGSRRKRRSELAESVPHLISDSVVASFGWFVLAHLCDRDGR